jgi:hypothetical protein
MDLQLMAIEAMHLMTNDADTNFMSLLAMILITVPQFNQVNYTFGRLIKLDQSWHLLYLLQLFNQLKVRQ